MTRKQTAAVKGLIQQVPALASKTYVTVAQNADGSKVSLPYSVIHPSEGVDEATRLTGPRDAMHPRFVIHFMGTTAEQVQLLMEQAKARVIVNGFGIQPTVPGERTESMWWESPTPIQVDKDTVPWLVYGIAECGFTSHLA